MSAIQNWDCSVWIFLLLIKNQQYNQLKIYLSLYYSIFKNVCSCVLEK